MGCTYNVSVTRFGLVGERESQSLKSRKQKRALRYPRRGPENSSLTTIGGSKKQKGVIETGTIKGVSTKELRKGEKLVWEKGKKRKGSTDEKILR